MQKLKQYTYYCIIGVASFLALAFFPMLGSDVTGGWAFPHSVAGWLVWATTRLMTSAVNVMLFYSFMQQAILNVQDNDRYNRAWEKYRGVKADDVPLSPKQWNGKQYGKKGTTIFISTAFSTVALTQAIISYDWATALTILITITMGLIFGILQMKKAESYWTEEFPKWVDLYMKEGENNG